MDDAQLIRTDLTRLTNRVVEVEALTRRLQGWVDTLPSSPSPSGGAKAPEPTKKTCAPTGEAIDLKVLAEWVDQIQDRYAATGDWLRPCWWRHGFVVEELSALRFSWMGVYRSDEPPATTAALKWHDDAAKCRERIRKAISTGPGCTAVSHKPDQSVADDPRWAHERAALFATRPDPSDPPRGRAAHEDSRSDKGGDRRESPSPSPLLDARFHHEPTAPPSVEHWAPDGAEG
jgi:hypothetical protein